jgi:hypothetical protein
MTLNDSKILQLGMWAEIARMNWVVGGHLSGKTNG